MAQNRNLQMAEVFCHPLGPLPWALATPEGLICGTDKSALSRHLQKNAASASVVPDGSATIVDGMALVNRLTGNHNNFGDVAMAVLKMALKEGSSSKRIDVVFDTYKEVSIKNMQRLIRGEELGVTLQNISASQLVRQWREFLSKVGNKTSLITFMVNEWKTEKYTAKLKEKILYATCEDKCYKITSESTETIEELESLHEEADGRLLFHAAHAAAAGFKAVIVAAEDTDVLILCLKSQSQINVPLFVQCGKARKKQVDIKKIAHALGPACVQGIVGMHAYTGCDTVSSLFGKGKINILKLMCANPDVQNAFAKLGEEYEVSEGLFDILEKATCLIYAAKTKISNVNELRYHLFCAKKGEIESYQMPPCKDSLKKHVMCANYQAAIWKRCLVADPETPNPINKGWKWEDERELELAIDWMDGLPAPQAVLDLLACDCRRVCKLPNCECLANGLKCTDMCRLVTCDNQKVEDSVDEEFNEDTGDDKEDLFV